MISRDDASVKNSELISVFFRQEAYEGMLLKRSKEGNEIHNQGRRGKYVTRMMTERVSKRSSGIRTEFDTRILISLEGELYRG